MVRTQRKKVWFNRMGWRKIDKLVILIKGPLECWQLCRAGFNRSKSALLLPSTFFSPYRYVLDTTTLLDWPRHDFGLCQLMVLQAMPQQCQDDAWARGCSQQAACRDTVVLEAKRVKCPWPVQTCTCWPTGWLMWLNLCSQRLPKWYLGISELCWLVTNSRWLFSNVCRTDHVWTAQPNPWNYWQTPFNPAYVSCAAVMWSGSPYKMREERQSITDFKRDSSFL